MDNVAVLITLFQKFHYGIVNVSDGKCRPQPARLKVCSEFLVLQREEFIFPDEEDGYPADDKVSDVRYGKLSWLNGVNVNVLIS